MAADSDQAGRHRAVTPGVCVLALLLAGCGGGATGKGNRMATVGDPLVGPVTPTGSPSVASIGAPTGGVPPLPAPSASTAPAALATKTAPSFSSDRSAPSTPAGVWREPSSGATLSMPVPPNRGSAAPPTPPPSGFVVPAGGPGSVQTIDQGLKALEQRGARGFRLELQRDTAQWRCSCSVPNRQNPAYKQTYDTTAADPLSAVRAIVERLERENP